MANEVPILGENQPITVDKISQILSDQLTPLNQKLNALDARLAAIEKQPPATAKAAETAAPAAPSRVATAIREAKERVQQTIQRRTPATPATEGVDGTNPAAPAAITPEVADWTKNLELGDVTTKVLTNIENANERKTGTVRAVVLPIAGGISARWGVDRAAEFAHIAASLPGVGALLTGGASLVAAAIRRNFNKEQLWNLYGTYSHTEGGKGWRGGVKKAAQLFFREPERRLLEWMIGMKGSAGVSKLRTLLDETNADQLKQITEKDAVKLIHEGEWYLAGFDKAKKIGAHINEKDKIYYEASQAQIKASINQLENKFFDGDKRKAFRIKLIENLKNREKWAWRAGALAAAGFGSVRAFVLTPVITRIGTWLTGDGLTLATHAATSVQGAVESRGISMDTSGIVPWRVENFIQEARDVVTGTAREISTTVRDTTSEVSSFVGTTASHIQQEGQKVLDKIYFNPENESLMRSGMLTSQAVPGGNESLMREGMLTSQAVASPAETNEALMRGGMLTTQADMPNVPDIIKSLALPTQQITVENARAVLGQIGTTIQPHINELTENPDYIQLTNNLTAITADIQKAGADGLAYIPDDKKALIKSTWDEAGKLIAQIRNPSSGIPVPTPSGGAIQ